MRTFSNIPMPLSGMHIFLPVFVQSLPSLPKCLTREEERGSSQSRLGGGDGDFVCNDPEIGSFRNDDLLFYRCLMVSKDMWGKELGEHP
jgi:hypothetical protein